MAEGASGWMLAVLATWNVIDEVLESEGIDLVIANKNAPRQFVLSGPTKAIERAAVAYERRQVTTLRLPVAAAFHSPAVSAASAPFLEALRRVGVFPTATDVYANSAATAYARGPDSARALLAR